MAMVRFTAKQLKARAKAKRARAARKAAATRASNKIRGGATLHGVGALTHNAGQAYTMAVRAQRAGHPARAGMREMGLTAVVSRDVTRGYEGLICMTPPGKPAKRMSNRAYDLRAKRGAKTCAYSYGPTPTKAIAKAMRLFSGRLLKRK